jgi:CDP-diacylglycerol--serine O-phosphatidyltransferase
MNLSLIPNAITLINLLAGSGVILCLLYGHLEPATWLVGVCVLADFLDGAVARALRAHSLLGKQLDSLADMVAFGVVPGIMMYGLIAASWNQGKWPADVFFSALPGLLLTVFAALRLGKFNIDERQGTGGFIGLPTPACTILVTGLLLIFHNIDSEWVRQFFQPWLLYGLTAALCWLMVAEIPMLALKFKNFGWAGNEIKYIFVLISLVLLIVLKEAAPALIIVIYAALSVVFYFPARKQKL